MLKFKVTIEVDEEQLRDIFENQEVKFSKAKAKQVGELLDEYYQDWMVQFEELYEEMISEIIQEQFEK